MRIPRHTSRLLIVALLVAAAAPARAEIVEEIVAWVNGDIITRSQFEYEEEQMVAEAYRRYTGKDLDDRVSALRATLLIDMIDRRILLDRARMVFSDMNQIRDFYFRSFKESQKVTDEAEFARLLEQEGMTVEQFKDRLLELYAPEEVMRMEVRDRVSVSDGEVAAYYRDHPQVFVEPDQVTIREIVLLASTSEDKERRRAEAQAIVDELRAGADFAEVARRSSEAGTKDDGGLLGPLGKGDLARPLEELALTLPIGEVSDVIDASHGFHILKVESRAVNAVKSLEDVREKIRAHIEERKFAEARQAFIEKIRGDAEWCVKPRYRDRIDAAALRAMQCENL